MNITTEITSVSVKDKPWDGPQGPIWFVEGSFQDGSQFSIGSKSPEVAHQRKAILEGLKGQQGTFEVDQKGEYQGKPKYKLLSWPGKEGAAHPGDKQPGPFQSQRAAGGYQPRFRDTEEGAKQERDSIHRSVALQQAILYVSNHKEEGAKMDPALWCCNLADHFYEWLSQEQPKAEAPKSDKSIAVLASESIDACVKNKSLDHLAKVRLRIVERYSQKSITDEELAALEGELTKAKQAIESAINHDQWSLDKQRDALKRDPGVRPDPLQEQRDRF